MTTLKHATLFDPPGDIECTVYVMRHGQTCMDAVKRSDGWLDLPLSDKGRMGVIPPQQHLKLVPLTKIYAPSLKRTTETADIIRSGTVAKPPVKVADQARTWNLGALSGTLKGVAKPKVGRLMRNPDEAPLGGESYSTFTKRFMPWFEGELEAARKSGKPVLFILSGSNLRLLGDKLFGDRQAVNVDEAGLAALHYSDGKWHREGLFGGEEQSPYET